MWNFTKGLLIIALAICSLSIKAQVGINKDDPNPAAILDIESDTLGVLFPRIADSSFLDKEKGLFFYATGDDKFYVYNGSNWQCVNPFLSTGPNNARLNGSLEVQGNVSVEPESTISGYGTVPIGGIIMWSGDHTNIPEGWALCNGEIVETTQTPDLRGRFVVGYSDGNKNSNDPRYDGYGDKNNAVSLAYQHVGDVGGDTLNRLTKENIPNHTHGKGSLNIIASGSHTHTTNAPQQAGESTNDGSGHHVQKNDGAVATIGSNTHTHPNSTFSGITGDWGGHMQEAVYEVSIWGYPCQYDIESAGCADVHPFTNYPDITANCMGGHLTPVAFMKGIDPEGNLIIIPNPDWVGEPDKNTNCFLNKLECDYGDEYNKDYGKSILISSAAMGVDPIENRPPYYVIAYIIRVK